MARRNGAGFCWSRQDSPGHLTETDPDAVGAGGGGPDGDGVAVLEERAGGAVGECDRVFAVPCEFQERAALAGSGPETVPEAVPGAQRGPVGGEEGELLGGRPAASCPHRPTEPVSGCDGLVAALAQDR